MFNKEREDKTWIRDGLIKQLRWRSKWQAAWRSRVRDITWPDRLTR